MRSAQPDSVWLSELLEGLDNPGAKWVKLEVLGDKKTLLPDPLETLRAAETLIGEGFTVLAYANDDPILCQRLKALGCASVMPLGSPIGSGQGVLNPNNIRIILEQLKNDDPTYPVIVDAGGGDRVGCHGRDGTRRGWRVAEHGHCQCP